MPTNKWIFITLALWLISLTPLTNGFADSRKQIITQRLRLGENLQDLLEQRYQLIQRLIQIDNESSGTISPYQLFIPRASAIILLEKVQQKLKQTQLQFTEAFGHTAFVEELLTTPKYHLNLIREITQQLLPNAFLEREWQEEFPQTAPLSVNATDLEHLLLRKLRAAQIMLSVINGEVDKHSPERKLVVNTINEYHQAMRMNMAYSQYPIRSSKRQFSNYPIPKDHIRNWTVAPSLEKLLAKFVGVFPKNCNNVLAEVL